MKTKQNNVMTGAEILLKSLLCEKVDLIFGYPGGAIMPTYDALHHIPEKLRHILVRHEQGAVHAAEGYARATGKVGVCLVTSGPGATNVITGLADAMLDSTPVICITGQVHSQFLGSDAFQETDIISMTVPVTKWNVQITRAEDIPAMLAKAFYIARTGRPGPVLIDITKDAQFEKIAFNEKKYPCFKPAPVHLQLFGKKSIDLKACEKAAKLINQSKKPYILAGQGILISKAEKELSDFSMKGEIPVASTLLGLSAMPSAHPFYVGMLGMHGNYAPNLLTNEADLIIAVGMRFDDRVTGNLSTYAKQAKIIHIDIDPSEINKNILAEVGLIGDAKAVLQKLIPLIKCEKKLKNYRKEWLNQFTHHHETEYQKIISKEIHAKNKEIKMAQVIHALSEKTKGQAIIVTDVGQHQMISARYYQFEKSHSHITSGGLGTMGFALPGAIGAKLGCPHRQVVAIIGDGGFQMNIQELAVIAQENIPVKIIILNNHFLGMVRQWQELFFEERYSFTEMKNPDFVKISQGYGIAAQKVTQPKDLSKALNKMLESPVPYLLEVCVEKKENVFPMVPSGFGVGDVRLS